GEPVGDLSASAQRLRGTELDGDLVLRAIDEVPILAVLGAIAGGTTVIRGAAELRVKESDRLAQMARGLRAMGAQVEGLPGGPGAHSRSPAIHARAFTLLGVDAAYAPCRVPADDLERAVDGLRALAIDGFNVTVPHKTAVAQLVDRLHLGATRIGAVNCVARDGEALVGHNTDAPGLVRALRSRRIDPSGRAVVVGAGGAARAAAFALAEHAQGLT